MHTNILILNLPTTLSDTLIKPLYNQPNILEDICFPNPTPYLFSIDNLNLWPSFILFDNHVSPPQKTKPHINSKGLLTRQQTMNQSEWSCHLLTWL